MKIRDVYTFSIPPLDNPPNPYYTVDENFIEASSRCPYLPQNREGKG